MLVEITKAAGTLGIVARPIGPSQDAGAFLAGYLNNDLQGDAEHARQVLQHLDAVQSGQEPSWSESGNAYVITIDTNAVTLDFHWAEEGQPDSETVPAEDFRQALRAWIDTLHQSPD